MSRAALLLALALTACPKKDAASAPVAAPAVADGGRCSGAPQLARRLTAPLTVDGHLDEADWRRTPSSGAWRSERDGRFVSPHTEVRALWRADALLLGLYAADEDLRGDDGFTVSLERADAAPLTLWVPARGAVTCRAPAGGHCAVPEGIAFAVDTDGTFDDPSDDDEEWAVELVVPWKALGFATPPARLRLDATRTDTPKGAAPRTSAWAQRCGASPAWAALELENPPVLTPQR